MKCGVCGTQLMEGAARCPICKSATGASGGVHIETQPAAKKEKQELTLERVGLRPMAKTEKGRSHPLSLEDQLAELEREVGPVEGGEVEVEEFEPTYPQEVLKELQLVPGIDEAKAKMLYDLGYGDLETVLLGAMRGQPDAASLAKILSIRLKAGPVKKVSGVKVKCPDCKTVTPLEDVCPVCGLRLRKSMEVKEEKKVDEVLRKAAEAAGAPGGDVMQALTIDAFFRALPETMQRVIREHAEDLVGDPRRESVIRQRFGEQIAKWKEKGYAVEALDVMLQSDLRALLLHGRDSLGGAPRPAGPSGPETRPEAPATLPAPPKPAAKQVAKPSTPAKAEAAVKKAAAAQSKTRPGVGAKPQPGKERTPGWCSICGEPWKKGTRECGACATPLKEQRACPKCKIPLHPSMKSCPYEK